MSVIDYNTKIKEICDALGSINVMVDEDEMVQICLGGLAQTYGPIRKAICTQEKSSLFFNLQSMLMVEENHASGSRTTQSGSRMLYTEADWPCGHGGRGGLARNVGGRQEQERRHRGGADSSSDKQRPTRNAGIVAGRATERASVGRSAPIQTNPDLIEPNKEIGSGHTTMRAPKELEMDRSQPS